MSSQITVNVSSGVEQAAQNVINSLEPSVNDVEIVKINNYLKNKITSIQTEKDLNMFYLSAIKIITQ